MAYMVEASEDEVEGEKHLPFPQILVVIQYPSAFTKLEMRYAVSVLSRFRGAWGVKHFAAALKALEYGWSTRRMSVGPEAGLRRGLQSRFANLQSSV